MCFNSVSQSVFYIQKESTFQNSDFYTKRYTEPTIEPIQEMPIQRDAAQSSHFNVTAPFKKACPE